MPDTMRSLWGHRVEEMCHEGLHDKLSEDKNTKRPLPLCSERVSGLVRNNDSLQLNGSLGTDLRFHILASEQVPGLILQKLCAQSTAQDSILTRNG